MADSVRPIVPLKCPVCGVPVKFADDNSEVSYCEEHGWLIPDPKKGVWYVEPFDQSGAYYTRKFCNDYNSGNAE